MLKYSRLAIKYKCTITCTVYLYNNGLLQWLSVLAFCKRADYNLSVKENYSNVFCLIKINLRRKPYVQCTCYQVPTSGTYIAICSNHIHVCDHVRGNKAYVGKIEF